MGLSTLPGDEAVIGKLRHRITFQSVKLTADDYGGHEESWGDDFTLWAAVEPANGRERFFAGKVEQVVTHKITIRAGAGVSTKHRIAFGCRLFQIHGIVNLEERGKFMELSCQEGVGS